MCQGRRSRTFIICSQSIYSTIKLYPGRDRRIRTFITELRVRYSAFELYPLLRVTDGTRTHIAGFTGRGSDQIELRSPSAPRRRIELRIFDGQSRVLPLNYLGLFNSNQSLATASSGNSALILTLPFISFTTQ